MKAGGGSGHRSALAGVDRLVTIAVGGGIIPSNVGRQGHVTDPFHAREEIVNRSEADVAFAEFSAPDDLGLKIVAVAEEKMLADSDLAARADEAFPIVWALPQLARQQDFDAAAQKIARSGILRAERLGLQTAAASIEARGKYARVVEDDEIVGVQQIRKVAEVPVRECARCSREM
jgi:hypothetical protein